MKQTYTATALLLLLLLLASCDKADRFYAELYDKPEIIELGYGTTYEVGDTFTIYGRLHLDRNFSLRIGDADAELVYKGYDKERQSELVRTIIRAEMGAGNNRPVRLTADNAWLDAPPINIYSSSGAGYQRDTLALESYCTLPDGVLFAHCRSENGNVYYWHTATKTLTRVLPNGTKEPLLEAGNLTDEQGAFVISAFYSGAVDPQENYFYFSAQTTDKSADNSRNFIYRFCRVALASKTLTTLNRTLVRKGTLPAVMTTPPLEGNISTVNLTGIGYICPDSKGNIYLQPRAMVPQNDDQNQRYATALLTPDGTLSYLLKSRTIGLPNLSDETALTLLPGIAINGAQGVLSPDEGLMFTNPVTPYTETNVNTILGYDLRLKAQIYTLVTQKPPKDRSLPVIYGEFAGLSGDTESLTTVPARFGFMPIGGGRLLLLYYQKHYSMNWNKFPALGVLDFPHRRGDRYAPGAVEMGPFQLLRENSGSYKLPRIYNESKTEDKMLNTDPQGMLYMSANNRAVLVKTTKKK